MRYEDEIRRIITEVAAVTEPIDDVSVDMNLQNAGMTSLTICRSHSRDRGKVRD